MVGEMEMEELSNSVGKKMYPDIFDENRPVHTDDWFSIRHPGMTVRNRAKLFSAFDALDGYSDTIRSKGIVYFSRRQLSEEEKGILSEQLFLLCKRGRSRKSNRENPIKIRVQYFVPHPDDPERGQIQVLEGILAYIDPNERYIEIGDQVVSFEMLESLEIEWTKNQAGFPA